MERTFPAFVLKVEYCRLMPGTTVPTGTDRRTEWFCHRSLNSAHGQRLLLKHTDKYYKSEYYRLLRITLCVIQKNGNHRKLFIWTTGEKRFSFRQDAYAPKDVCRARVAIIPAGVVNEATRQTTC